MSCKIITGYTGERHITPNDDAKIFMGLNGENPSAYIMAEGDRMHGSMPSINQFTVGEGVLCVQGHMVINTQETLAVDTCATGYSRIDLVVAKYTHDTDTQIDDAELVIIKGTEVADPNEPQAPSIHTGIIQDGATEVDTVLYTIELHGGDVAFTRTVTLMGAPMIEAEVIKAYVDAGWITMDEEWYEDFNDTEVLQTLGGGE